MHIQDEIAARKSKMMQRPSICNGEQSGIKCKHYFSFAARTDAANPEFLNLGEKFRNCTVCPGWLIEFDGSESLPHHCDRYVPDYHGFTWLVWKFIEFVKSLTIIFGARRLDRSFEDYNPMTQEEVAQLTAEAHEEERQRVEKLHSVKNNGSDLHDVADQFIGIGIPGQTTMATPEMLKEQIKNSAAVKEGKKTIDEVLAEMLPKTELVTISQSKSKKSTPKKNPKMEKLAQSDKEASSDGGIFSDNGSHE